MVLQLQVELVEVLVGVEQMMPMLPAEQVLLLVVAELEQREVVVVH